MNVTFDDFKKIEIRIGKVLTCEKIENADKLLRLQVDSGDFKRQIISGIAQWYQASFLYCWQFAHLKPLYSGYSLGCQVSTISKRSCCSLLLSI